MTTGFEIAVFAGWLLWPRPITSPCPPGMTQGRWRVPPLCTQPQAFRMRLLFSCPTRALGRPRRMPDSLPCLRAQVWE